MALITRIPFLSALVVLVVCCSAAEGMSCAEIEGLEPLLEQGNVLIFGELHGSQESPGFVGEVACRALMSGFSVTLGLELLDREASGVAAFLASAGGKADRESLTGVGAWHAEYQDGRTSQAVVELLDQVRKFKSAGKPISVELFDRGGWRSPQERDALMAQALATVLEKDDSGIVVVLTGNIHSRIGRGTPWSETYEPMTHLLANLTERRLVSLNVAHAGGSAWMCNGSEPSSCGVRQVSGGGEQAGWSIELGGDLSATGHHGRYHVGFLNASLPARSR